MDAMKAEVGLAMVVNRYKLFYKNNFAQVGVIFVIGIFLAIIFVQIKTSNYVDVLKNTVLNICTTYFIVVIMRKMASPQKPNPAKDILKICIVTVIYSAAYFGVAVLSEIFPQWKAVFAQMITMIIDVLMAISIYKLLISDKKKRNTKEDNIFILKFCLFYYFARGLAIIAIGILFSTILTVEQRARYIPVMGVIIRMLFLPVIAVYYEAKTQMEKDIGIIS